MSNLRRFAFSCLCFLLLPTYVAHAQADAGGDSIALASTTRWVSAWNAHDAMALGKLLTADVDFVLVNGMLLRGRQDFTHVHAEQFSGRYRNSVFQRDGEPDFSLIRTDVAVVHWRWSITGVENPDGSPAQIYHGIFTWVLVRKDDVWAIRAAQNTVDR
jgi:uncharacterized protein (TIGR02246 family)